MKRDIWNYDGYTRCVKEDLDFGNLLQEMKDFEGLIECSWREKNIRLSSKCYKFTLNMQSKELFWHSTSKKIRWSR